MQARIAQQIESKQAAFARIATAVKGNEKRAVGFALAVMAASSYAIAMVLTRQNVASVASPLAASVLTLASGTMMLWLMNVRNLRRVNFRTQRRGILLFALGGVCSAVGVMCLFYALKLAPIVVVSPLVAINPLVAILLAHVFLQRLEKISLRIFMGALLVVAGVVTIGLAR